MDQEKIAEEKGIARYRRIRESAQKSGHETRMGPPLNLARRLIEPTSALLKERITTPATAGVNAAAIPYLRTLKPDQIAWIGARTVIDRISQGSISLGGLCLQIANRIQAENDLISFRRADRTTYERTAKYIRLHRRDESTERAIWRHAIKTSPELEWSPIDRGTGVRLGAFVLDALIDATGLFEIHLQRGKSRKTNILRAKPELIEMITKADREAELMKPWHLPLFTPPRDWTNPWDGGYEKTACTIVKTANTEYLQDLALAQPTKIYAAVNQLQRTPFKINEDVLTTAEILWDADTRLAGLPGKSPDEIPPKPDREDWETFRLWRHTARKIHASNDRRNSQAMHTASSLNLARQYVDKAKLFYPHNLDFRGRAYPLPIFLSPMSTELNRALLTFAEARPITNDSHAMWLAVHGANCFGVDKVSFSDRVEWVNDNESVIREIAEDPIENTRWHDADKPFMFLAFAIEWSAFKDHGWGFMSSLPCAMDGTANGYQHLSAAILDLEGAQAVNMTASEIPSDIYQRVADVVLESVHKDITNDPDNVIAKTWIDHNLINRKLTKRPTMTTPYGLLQYGMRTQILDHLNALYDGKETPFGADTFPAVAYISDKIQAGIETVVRAAKDTMDFLQSAARAAAVDNKPLKWTNPAGLPVMQAYWATRPYQITTKLAGRTIKPTIRVTKDERAINRKKSISSISPNWVHSQDSGHMMLTIAACADERPEMAFATLHDSYSTHATDCPLLATVLREQFIKIYEQPQLAMFRHQIARSLSEEAKAELSDLPKMGHLKLKDLLDAEYFFA